MFPEKQVWHGDILRNRGDNRQRKSIRRPTKVPDGLPSYTPSIALKQFDQDWYRPRLDDRDGVLRGSRANVCQQPRHFVHTMCVLSCQKLHESRKDIKRDDLSNIVPFPFRFRDAAKFPKEDHCPQMVIPDFRKEKLFQGSFVCRELSLLGQRMPQQGEKHETQSKGGKGQ